MQFNPGDGTGFSDEVNDTCNSDNNSFPLTSKARRINAALDRFFTLAFQADGRFTFDDVNHGSAPIETINLVANTQSYALSSFTSEILNVLRVEMLDENGNAVVLTRLKRENVQGALTEYKDIAGTPTEYDLIGNYIYLYPKPSYNSTNGLRFYFNRNKSAFTSSDTTKALPVPSLFTQYICNHASLPYLIEYQKPQKNDVMSLIQRDEKAILDYFENREKGENPQMTMKPICYQ